MISKHDSIADTLNKAKKNNEKIKQAADNSAKMKNNATKNKQASTDLARKMALKSYFISGWDGRFDTRLTPSVMGNLKRKEAAFKENKDTDKIKALLEDWENAYDAAQDYNRLLTDTQAKQNARAAELLNHNSELAHEIFLSHVMRPGDDTTSSQKPTNVTNAQQQSAPVKKNKASNNTSSNRAASKEKDIPTSSVPPVLHNEARRLSQTETQISAGCDDLANHAKQFTRQLPQNVDEPESTTEYDTIIDNLNSEDIDLDKKVKVWSWSRSFFHPAREMSMRDYLKEMMHSDSAAKQEKASNVISQLQLGDIEEAKKALQQHRHGYNFMHIFSPVGATILEGSLLSKPKR